MNPVLIMPKMVAVVRRRAPPPPMMAVTVAGGIQTPLKGENYSQNYRILLTPLGKVFYHNKNVYNADFTVLSIVFLDGAISVL
jgi:hypothetical protein